jgi:RNA polymerase sigma-70 factor (ECF subfamily)
MGMDAQLSVQHEARVISSILAGDRERYHELIRAYERGVYKLAFLLMKNEADAEDLAQEAFSKAFRKLVDFRSHATFSTLLINITLNEARRRLQCNLAD